MNKSNLIYLGVGFLVGGGAGAVASYFATKEMFAQQAAEEIENYAEHCEERIKRIRLEHEGEKRTEDTRPEKVEDPEEEKIENNAGVKRYHHSTGLDSGYGSNHIFEKPQDLKEKNEIKKQIKENKLINEIDEDEWMNTENGYEKQTLDVFLGDDEYVCGIWGYGTDNEEDAEKRFGQPLSTLVGSMSYDELMDMIDPEEGVGRTYVRNDKEKIEFELVIHDNTES